MKTKKVLSFSGHDSFPLRHGWLEKAYHSVATDGVENPFSSADSIVKFGVGKNMVTAIKYWAIACNFLEKTKEGFRPSSFAKGLMNGEDPYLEDIDSLWKIHYELCKKPSNTTIYWIFSHLNTPTFNKDYLELKLKEFCLEQEQEALPAEKTLRTDINVALALYCGSNAKKLAGEDDIVSPLQDLKLVSINKDGSYSINSGRKTTLSDELFLSTVIDFWLDSDRKAGFQSNAVRVDRLLYGPGTPGRIFAMSETELIERLERFKELTSGGLYISDTAGLIQLYKDENFFNDTTKSNKWSSNE